MNGPRHTAERRTTTAFLVLHVGVACAVYITALAMGDGFSGTPMPPDESPITPIQAAQLEPAPADASPRSTPGQQTNLSDARTTDPRDTPPAWWSDPAAQRYLTDR